MTNRNMGGPDETMTFDNGRVEVVRIGGSTIRRNTFEPGWRWSEHVGSMA